MNDKIVTVKIPEDLCTYIESLHYEVESRKSLIAFALDHDLTNTDSFNRYEKEYKEFFIQYETAKNEMQKEYIVNDYPNFKSWGLEFDESQLTIELK